MLQLLDDEEPAIQSAISKELADTSGDLSHEIAALGVDISTTSQKLLSEMLLPGRRETLMAEWQVPPQGSHSVDGDYETFESYLSMVSDFLHDGITLRPSLPDLLDILAEEARTEKAHISENALRAWLFESGRFKGNKDNYYAPENSDLCWCIDNETGNPISLSLIYILVARRLNLEVHGCNYPGHFLAMIQINGKKHLADCFHRGRLISVEEVLNSNKHISDYARHAITESAPLGSILLRIIRNLMHCFKKGQRFEDEKVFTMIFDKMHVD
ncbi:transglutaminase-like domain-containing protein [Rubritalea marina]|uniref:transglutaminase-like domain-containing protein n=1 Tax=Rubritalea marina TaxID=361055 RepID=UPI00037FBFFC|nr:transglutaminase-like domain-containing protein [Rubritalea marina]